MQGVKYDEAKDPTFDEVMVKIVKEGSLFSRGWLGLSPDALRAGDADDPQAICNTLHMIRVGKLPTAAYQYMLSAAHQYRIRYGMAAPVQRMTQKRENESDKAGGTSETINREFNKNVAIEKDVRKHAKTEDTERETQAAIDKALDEALDPAYKKPLGLVDEHGNLFKPEDPT
jgi:hypothetical protein